MFGQNGDESDSWVGWRKGWKPVGEWMRQAGWLGCWFGPGCWIVAFTTGWVLAFTTGLAIGLVLRH